MDIVLIYLQILTAKNKIDIWQSETRINFSRLWRLRLYTESWK